MENNFAKRRGLEAETLSYYLNSVIVGIWKFILERRISTDEECGKGKV